MASKLLSCKVLPTFLKICYPWMIMNPGHEFDLLWTYFSGSAPAFDPDKHQNRKNNTSVSGMSYLAHAQHL